MSNSKSPESKGIVGSIPLPGGGDIHDHVFIDSTTGKLNIQTTISPLPKNIKHINKTPLE